MICVQVLAVANACEVDAPEALVDIGVDDLHARYVKGDVSALEIVDWHLERVECDSTGQRLNAVAALNPNARAEAARIDGLKSDGMLLGPLHGIPVIVKGNHNVAGMINDGGSAAWAAIIKQPPLKESFELRRLREAGAVIIGRSNLDDLAYGDSTTSSAYGQTRNPHAPSGNLSPGGSSGGSAVALVANFALLANGTDDGGSNRIPAQFSGVVGLKTTYGLVSKSGVIPTVPLLDHHGPLARTVADVALMLQVVAGKDPDDLATRSFVAGPAYAEGLSPNALRGARLGVVRQNLYAKSYADAFVQSQFVESVRQLEEAGARVVDVEAPVATREGMRDAYRALGGDPDGDRRLHKAAGANALHRYFLESYGAQGESLFRRVYETPLVSGYYGLSGTELEDALRGLWETKPETVLFEQRRRALVSQLVADMDRERIDALIWPTVPFASAPIGAWPGPTALHVANFLGIPELSVPAGRSTDGVGGMNLSFVGRPFDEHRLLALGNAFEAIARQAD